MPRLAQGVVETHRWKDGRTVTYRARIPAYGQRWRVNFGTNHEGWNPERAHGEVERIMERVARGTWEPPRQAAPPVEQPEDETFHVFASRWWTSKKRVIRETTQADYYWRLQKLLAHLAHTPVSQIDVRKVDGVRDALVGTGLSARSVNMALNLLTQILEDAVEYELLDANPARGRRRRLRVPAPPRSFLEPDMVVDLLNAAGEWEAERPEHQHYGRRAMLATLVLAGPRISELLDAERQDIDLEAGRLRVGRSKTAAGVRDIELTARSADELGSHLERGLPGKWLFPTRTGGRHSPTNVRRRALAVSVERANKKRVKAGRQPIPAVTPHSLRRTFASLSLAAGRDPRWVMAQLGHTNAELTLNVYAQVMQRRKLDMDLIWTLMRFPDEPRRRPGPGRNRPTKGTTNGAARRGRGGRGKS